MAASLVSSRDGASLAMLLTLELDDYMARSKVLKERSLKGMEAVGKDLTYSRTGTISNVDLYWGRGGLSLGDKRMFSHGDALDTNMKLGYS